MYFENCQTLEDLKKEYRRLTKIHHPDCGGDEQIMKQINSAYESKFNLLKAATGDKQKGRFDYAEKPQDFIRLINNLVKLHGLQVEIIGAWVWVTGETFANRHELAKLGFRFSKSKKAWYWFCGVEKAPRTKGRSSLNKSRLKYGSTVLASSGEKQEERQAITA